MYIIYTYGIVFNKSLTEVPKLYCDLFLKIYKCLLP